ncbi:PIG-L deacetylase family protein [Granulicoccus sp. GXG6511]|uniref:PIG-L deacetylase family protein n=1 Tax=Granulicoccus sp. GXG6511 TaxID=3381351 RepID=UPI003D7CD6B0
MPRALVVVAHPDDADFGAGGTLAGLTDVGWEVTALYCTRGEQGGFDPSLHEQMPQIREREQRAAGEVLGISDVRFLDGYRDGWLQPTYDLQRDIVRVIRQVRPDLMLIQNAERTYDRIFASHPDHLACGEATIRAIYPAAENQFAWPELITDEGLEPFTVPEFWVMGHPAGTHTVDITGTIDRKVNALLQHQSQVAHRGDELGQMVRSRAASLAATHGLPDGHFAEDFLRIKR